ncbi:hypothetical protein DRE_00860 [Drechslerella stenobrocha 248]|uniref:Uncharacterized protein n=1 Tax=Drechslerella stenobrocha 248 TaxID=1043628 RepID=W7HN85_9PEZI|nr:hypothetical protein DRE_00860 [Drechslerella stenobrocha 248]
MITPTKHKHKFPVTSRKKVVRFAPLTGKSRKRQASPESTIHPGYRSKSARVDESLISSRVQNIINQALGKAYLPSFKPDAEVPISITSASCNEQPRKHTTTAATALNQDGPSTSSGVSMAPEDTTETPAVKREPAGASFDLPTKLVHPFDQETDLFKSMHTYVSCKADPMHVIGIKLDNSRRHCEGIESLDGCLLHGEVNVLFHKENQREPICEVCWTLKVQARTEAGGDDDGWEDEVRVPGGWPAEDVADSPAHTHVYTVFYLGCKLRKSGNSLVGHGLALVKGADRGDEDAEVYCSCPDGWKGSHESKGKGRRVRETKESQTMPRVQEEVFMPAFAGCPVCAKKKFNQVVRRITDL